MQNMYMTPLRYKNFAGVEKTTKLHFHLTPREFADWMIDNKAEAERLAWTFEEMLPQIEGDLAGTATTEQKMALLQLVRVIAELSYGKPSEDGEFFDKSETKKFAYSAAYDAFRIFLFENPKELVSFIETILNEQVVSEFGKRMERVSQGAEQQDAQPPALKSVNTQKDPQEMTREELLEAMKSKNRQQ